MSIFQGANLISIFDCYCYWVKMPIEERNRFFSFTVPMGLIICLFDYYYFVKDFKNIENKYKNDSAKCIQIAKIVLYAYIIITFLLFFKAGNFPYYLADGTKRHIMN